MEDISFVVVVLLVGFLVYTASLWIAAKLIGDEGRFLEFAIIAGISTAVSLIPYAGALLSLVVFFVLLSKLMDIDFLKAIVICVLAFTLRAGVLYLLERWLVEDEYALAAVGIL